MAQVKQKSKENSLLNLSFNIIIPALLMMKGKTWFDWSPVMALVIALSFPVAYGVYDFAVRRKYNFLSILGFVSILLTGGIGIFELSKDWIAIKEAAVPLIIGMAMLISLKTKHPLIRTLIYREEIIEIERVNHALEERGNKKAFDQLLKRCTWWITLSFLLSSILNYTLAKVLIKSESGTQAFTEELGAMTFWSYPVIVVPCTVMMGFALWKLVKGIKELTELELEAIFVGGK